MKFVFAIGNPGLKYEQTYHNLGILYAAFLEEKFQQQILSKNKHEKYELIKFSDFILIKSNVFMNVSFSGLVDSYKMYKFQPENLLVLHDELMLKKYQIKIKLGGGLAGHNGLRDISKHLGPDFARMRIGIDHPKNLALNIDIDKYVLSKIKDMQEYDFSFEVSLDQFNSWIAS